MFNRLITLRICLEFDQWVSCQRMTWVIWEYYTTSPCVVSWMPWPYLPQISEHRTKQTTLKKNNKLGTHKIWHSNKCHRNIVSIFTAHQWNAEGNVFSLVCLSVAPLCTGPRTQTHSNFFAMNHGLSESGQFAFAFLFRMLSV